MADGELKENRLYSFVRGVAKIVFHTLMPVKYHNAERLRAEAPFVMISNHQHALDPAILTVPLKKKEQAIFLGKKELVKNRFAAWFLGKLHIIPVDRHNMDMEAMRKCMRVLKENRILGIFPEGTRHHEGQMEQIESGTSLIVLRSKVPLIPVYIDRKLGFFKTTNAWIGEPIPYDDLLAKGINTDTCDRLNERMRETFRKMIAETKKV